MGLAASQARYLFISSRINDLESNLMSISAKDLALTDKANDISEQYNFALNNTNLALNGQIGFGYDQTMGETAMNSENGLYMLSDSKNKTVLTSTYAKAAKAAGISEDGSSTLADNNNAKAAFLNAVKGSPKKANDWNEVL